MCITVQLWVTQITHAIQQEYSHLPVSIYAFLNSAVVRELFSEAENYMSSNIIRYLNLKSVKRHL